MPKKRKHKKGKPEPPPFYVTVVDTDFWGHCGYCHWTHNVGTDYEDAITFVIVAHINKEHFVGVRQDRRTFRWTRAAMRIGLTYRPNRTAPHPVKHSPTPDPTWTPPIHP